MELQPIQDPTFDAAVQCIVRGDVAKLRSLLRCHPHLAKARSRVQPRATLLHYTSFNGLDETAQTPPPTTPQIARLLLEFGAEPDAPIDESPSSTPLSWALSSWFPYAARIQIELADAYLDGGARIDGVGMDGAPLGHAIMFGYTSAVEHLVRRGARSDHLLGAAALGDFASLTGRRGADGTYDERALKFERSDQDETGRFSWPPARGAQPDAIALVVGAIHNRIEVVAGLLDLGVPVDAAMTRKQTALHHAAHLGHSGLVRLLLDRGADPDAVEEQFHRTPAEWAMENGEHEIAQSLGRKPNE